MRSLMIALLVAAIAGCSTISVTADYDPEEDFSVYHTYTWIPRNPQATGNPRLDTPMHHDRVREAVDRVLAQKGFRKVGDDPDFWITFHQAVEQKLDVRTMNSGYHSGYYGGGRGWTMSVPETRVTEYAQGTFVIDIADAREKELVWRGIATGRLSKTPPGPAEQREQFFQVATEILVDFPPR